MDFQIQALLSLLILSKTNGGQTSSLDACNAISYEARENCFSCYLVLRITLPMIYNVKALWSHHCIPHCVWYTSDYKKFQLQLVHF